jgi:pimeloyl-ACP methyl ester carboxylesterase
MKNEKTKIIILHGWAYDTAKWSLFVALLKEKKFDVVILKIPGLTAPLEEVWTLDSYVTWFKKIVDQEKEKVILLGHSNGGRIGLAFSIKYPEKVSRLILIDSAGIYHNELKLRLKRFIFGTLAKIGKKAKNIQAVKTLFYKLVREHDYEKANPYLRKTMQNLINADLSNVLQDINIPTTIIWGAADRITPLSDGKIMKQKIKGATLDVITDARHSPQFTHPEKVRDIIVREIK